MGRPAVGDPAAGWRACKRQSVLGTADYKGKGTIPTTALRNRINSARYEIVSPWLSCSQLPDCYDLLRFRDSGRYCARIA